MNKIPVGVSQCLLGDAVRYNGGHKHSRYITEVLTQFLELRPSCPEVAAGLGVPREPIRLVADGDLTRVKGSVDTGRDVTEALRREAEAVALQMPDICGYILMQKSPSCGLHSVKRYASSGTPKDNRGQGAFAARLRELLPLLPMEEAGRLNDPVLRENFITRLYAYHDWRRSLEARPSAAGLVAFYARYKYQVMAHHPVSYQAIGRLLADLRGKDPHEVNRQFVQLFMTALSRPVNRKGNANVMQHLQGYLKKLTSADEKAELRELIDAYRRGEVPLVAPLTLLKHYLRKVDMPYLQQQSFWSPHPEKLGLRYVGVAA